MRIKVTMPKTLVLRYLLLQKLRFKKKKQQKHTSATDLQKISRVMNNYANGTATNHLTLDMSINCSDYW